MALFWSKPSGSSVYQFLWLSSNASTDSIVIDNFDKQSDKPLSHLKKTKNARIKSAVPFLELSPDNYCIVFKLNQSQTVSRCVVTSMAFQLRSNGEIDSGYDSFGCIYLNVLWRNH